MCALFLFSLLKNEITLINAAMEGRKNSMRELKFRIHDIHVHIYIGNIPSSPAYGVLSHNSSDTEGLTPLMNVLFCGRCDFPISFSGRDMSRNVWNRLLGSSMVGMGILPNTRFPSPECYTIGGWPYTVIPTIEETLHQFLTLYWSGPYYRIWLFT